MINEIINKHYNDCAIKVDKELKKGLSLRGVDVDNEAKLKNYVIKNCTCDSHPDKQIYKDKGVPFLVVKNIIDFMNNKFETVIKHI